MKQLKVFVRKVNTHKDLGVNVYYDEYQRSFCFTSKSTGVESNVVFDTADPNTKSFFEEVLAALFQKVELSINGRRRN